MAHGIPQRRSALSDAALICAQSPSAAAGAAANPQITPDDPNPGTTACPKLCQTWVGKCKAIAAKAKSCFISAGAKVAAVRKATCNQLDDALKDSCKEAVKAEREALKSFVTMDAETGRGFCEGSGLANCLLNCS